MPAARTDRPRDSELSAPLRGEHHKDQEDEKDSGRDRERAEGGEEGHERVSGGVGVFDRVGLEWLDLEVERADDRLKQRDYVVGQRGAGDVPAPIGDEDRLDLALALVEPLRLNEGEKHRGVGGARSVEADNVAHPHRDRVGTCVDDDAISGFDPEFAGGLGVEIDLGWAQVGEGDLRAVGATDPREAGHLCRVGGEEDDARLVLTLGRRLHGDLLDDRAGDAVDEIRAFRSCRMRATVRSGIHPVPLAAPSAPGMSSTAPFGAIVSSVAPSADTAVVRIVWLMVSPVVKAAAMIVVPSISPTTMRALRPRRRPTLRSASFTRIRLRSASAPRTQSEPTNPTRRIVRSVSAGIPKTSFIGYATRTPSMSATATS